MTSVPALAQRLQTLLTRTADRLASATGCIRRHRKLSGATLVQILVLGWLHQPRATLHQLAQMAATLGVTISPQGLDQRFTEETATFLQQVLAAAVTQILASDPVAIPLLRRFAAVMIQDSSIVLLPASLATTWRGCGSADPQIGAAAIKLQVRLDLLTGALQGPLLQDGRVHDLKAPAQTCDLPAGALRLADLGYFSLDSLQRMSQGGVYWLTRWQAGTVVLDKQGRRLDLIPWLVTQGAVPVDCPVLLGQTYRLPVRLLVVRVSPEVAEQRRSRLHAEAHRRGQAVSPVRLPDGRVTAALSVLCEVIGLAPAPQARRIRADEVLAEQLLIAQIQTEGGPQAMDVLTAWAIPAWLQGIKLGKVAPEKRAAILAFKREAADILYRHFSERRPLPAPAALAPEQPITEPERPTHDAGRETWITYYRQMAAWLEWQADIETWRGQVESRLEGIEEVTRLIPELLERLGPRTLSPEHQSTVKAMAGRLHQVAGYSYGTIYSELNTAFHVGKYSDIPDAHWAEVAAWLQARIDNAQRQHRG
jgi:hypothetical protein